MPQQVQQRQLEAPYIRALRYRALTPFYDPLVRWALREMAVKSRGVAQAHLEPGQRVLAWSNVSALELEQTCDRARAA